MSTIPQDLRYDTAQHIWAALQDDGSVLLGITDYAQERMGELLYVELPEIESYAAGDVFSSVESSKKDQELEAPFDLEVVEVNDALEDSPERVNEDAYTNWICRVRPTYPEGPDALEDARAYQDAIASEA